MAHYLVERILGPRAMQRQAGRQRAYLASLAKDYCPAMSHSQMIKTTIFFARVWLVSTARCHGLLTDAAA